jgi:hypothetical protein
MSYFLQIYKFLKILLASLLVSALFSCRVNTSKNKIKIFDFPNGSYGILGRIAASRKGFKYWI